MSTDRISAVQSAKKRKAAQVQEDVGFPPALKPIITVRPACKPRFLLPCREDSTENCRDDSESDSGISCVGNCDEMLDDNEACKTPNSVEHQIPEILACPAAPRKPKATASKRPLEFFHVSACEFNLLFNLSWAKDFRSGERATEHLRFLGEKL